MPHDLEMDVRYGILPTKGESEGDIRGQSKVRESTLLTKGT